jgi:chromosome segregation ATPase
MKKLLESKEAERLLPPGDTKKMREEKNDLIKELEALKGSIVTTEEAWNQKLKDTQRELQMKDASVARLGREEKACMAKAAEEMEKLKTDLRTEQEQSSAKAEEITALQKNLDTEATARARAEQKARNAKRKLAAYQEDTEQKIETAKKLFTDHQYLLEYYCKNEPVPVKKSIMDSFEANYGLLKGPKQD